MAKKIGQNEVLIIIGIIILSIVATTQEGIPKEQIPIVKGSWDISDQTEKYNEFLIEEPDFDYSHPEIQKVAQEIKSSTTSAKQAIRDSADYVRKNVRYSSAITVSYCYNEKASDVLETGKGDCVSMSRLLTSLLRAQGIPARTMGGCLDPSLSCKQVFAAVPGLMASVTPMAVGDFKKRGFLHEYVHAWSPEEGWVLVEATAAVIVPLECQNYLDFGFDSNNRNRCTISDSSFWNQCNAFGR